jgi:hypothetical protein
VISATPILAVDISVQFGNANREVREYFSGTRLSELAYVYGGKKDGG